MPKFEVEFCDGKKAVVEKNTADEAKSSAKHERRQEMPRDTPASAAEVKVARVTKLDS